MMVKQTYTVRFSTPAFLGDADQNGAWRTPPFKALLRQWWRVAVAKNYGYDHAQLREAEGQLFGNAWLENNFSQSQIKLRLDNWQTGQLNQNQWPNPDLTVIHPEVTNPAGNPRPVGANLYLGYGPLIFGQGNTRLKSNSAVQANEKEKEKLTVIFPEASNLTTVLQLIHWFGTIGGRSRNGWGSLLLEQGNLPGFDQFNQQNQLLSNFSRSLQDCLQLDWPHAFGKSADGKLLIWKTKTSFSGWRETMKELAKIKIAFRTMLKFVKSKGSLEQRHILAYPVTNHPVNSLGNQSRLANQLRFKVIADNNQFFGIAYHLPCSIPKKLQDMLGQADRNWINQQQFSIWQTVHQSLDTTMQRI